MHTQRVRNVAFAAVVAAGAAWGAVAGTGCNPDVGRDPVPEAMEFDPTTTPPRAPQPTIAVINPLTGKIDLGLAGIPVAADCADATMTPAAARGVCEFGQFLQSLDGFPTTSTAQAPATAKLDDATLSVGTNVVVVDATAGARQDDVTVEFDDVSRSLVVRPRPSWTVGHTYWIGVRGYAGGVTADGGKPVIGSSTMALLKQPDPLGADAMALLAQKYPPDQVPLRLAQIDALRRVYQLGWAAMEGIGGLPRQEAAVLFGFPVQSTSVAELDPKAALVPTPTAPNELQVKVQGPVDPTTVSAFVFTQSFGSVMLIDLTEVAKSNLPGAFPRAQAAFADGAIVITAEAPLTSGHQYGVFLDDTIHDDKGRSLTRPPITVLLTARGPLTDAAGKSLISGVGDGDAQALEVGRQMLTPLFEGPDADTLRALTHLAREHLVYAFAFALP